MFGTTVQVDDAALGALAGMLARAGDEDPLSDACRLGASILGATSCAVYLADDPAVGFSYTNAPEGQHSLTLPLHAGGGRVAFAFAEPPEEDGALRTKVEAVASLLSLAVSRRQVAQNLASREAEAALLLEVGRLIDLAPEPTLALPAVLARAESTTGLQYVAILWQAGGAPLIASTEGNGLVPADLRRALVADETAGRAYLVASRSVGADSGGIAVEPESEFGRCIARCGGDEGMVFPFGGSEESLGALCVLGPTAKAVTWARTHGALAERLAAPLERARLFRLVERAKREWEGTFDTIAEGVAILDLDCKVIRANWAFAQMVGLTPRDVVGRHCHDLFDGEAPACEDCEALGAKRDDGSRRLKREAVAGNVRLSTSIYPFQNDRKHTIGSVHVLRDITDEKRLHETVVRNERLRALGEMATGVAHSFGNLLVSIGGWAEVLVASGEEGVQRPANAILQATLDGAEAVRRLQNYARSHSGTPYAHLDVNAVVRDALELSQPRWRPLATRRRVVFEVAVDLQPVPIVNGNPAELREVMVNLIFNAIDAMPEGGRLAVSTSGSGGEVRIAVHDSGIGMSVEVKERIFDPFFTTKGQGGSGLGLAIANGVVERHGGRIAVESEPGKGSAFTVVLPAAGKVNGRGIRRGR